MYLPFKAALIFYRSILSSFLDVKRIGSLSAQPLLATDASFKDALIARGRKFVALQGRHYREYDGYIIVPDPKAQLPPPIMPGQSFIPPPPKPHHFQVVSL